MQIYIRRNNEDFGPYSREAALEYVKQGIFQACDYACYAGMSEWKTVSELLGIASVSGPAKAPPTAASNRTRTPSPTSNTRHPALLRSMSGQVVVKKKGGMIALNAVLVFLVVAGIYIRMGGGGEKGQRMLAAISGLFSRPSEEPAPAFVAPAPVISAPVIEKAPAATVAPAAAPVAASTPAPPKPFDPADLAANPGAWPKTLKLKAATDFPAAFNGQIVGSVSVPAGTEVKLVNIQGDQLIVDYQGGTQKLSWKLTDIEEEAAKAGPVAPAATPATEATAATVNPAPPGN